MRKPIRSESEVKEAVAISVLYTGVNASLKTHCTNCSLGFSKENVWSTEGWVQTQTTGMCESCYEDIVDHFLGDES